MPANGYETFPDSLEFLASLLTKGKKMIGRGMCCTVKAVRSVHIAIDEMVTERQRVSDFSFHSIYEKCVVCDNKQNSNICLVSLHTVGLDSQNIL